MLMCQRFVVSLLLGTLMLNACGRPDTVAEPTAPLPLTKVSTQSSTLPAQPTRSPTITPTRLPATRLPSARDLPTPTLSISRVISAETTYLPNNGEITSVFFVDSEHGWVALGGTLLASVDGGLHWNTRYIGERQLRTLDFISAQVGWAVDGNGLIQTDDGGATWRDVDVHVDGGQVVAAEFVDHQYGWVLLKATPPYEHRLFSMLRTQDGGATWLPVAYPCNALPMPFNFISPAVGFFLCGDEPGAGSQGKSLLKTEDGGLSWNIVTQASMSDYIDGQLSVGGYITDLFFLDDHLGFFSSHYSTYGGIEATFDGGHSWKSLAGYGATTQIHFVSPMWGIALVRSAWQHGPAHHSVLLGTRDGGATWSQLYPPLAPAGPIQFFDAQHGVGLGTVVDSTAVLNTADGGHTWIQVGALTGKCDGVGLRFTDNLNGDVLLECYQPPHSVYQRYRMTNGNISLVEDLGSNATHAARGFVVFGSAEQKMTFPTGYTWVIGRDKRRCYLRSANVGSATWMQYDIDCSMHPQWLTFVDEFHGWMLGDHLYSTQDGGMHWEQLR